MGDISEIIPVVKNEIKILKSQKRCLNANMNHILIKCLNFAKSNTIKDKKKLIKLAESYITLARKKIPHYQVVTFELEKALKELEPSLLGKRAAHPLEYLSIRQEIPKPLASYDPLIEDEFLMRVPTKNRFDEKTLKQKVRKTEKDAMRELKKDSLTI